MYAEGEDVPAEDAAIADLERSIVCFENNIEMYRSRLGVSIREAKRYQDNIDDTTKRKRALEQALKKLKE